MSHTTIVECPDCGDRKLLSHSEHTPPSVWCNCDGFTKMDVDYHRKDGETMPGVELSGSERKCIIENE